MGGLCSHFSLQEALSEEQVNQLCAEVAQEVQRRGVMPLVPWYLDHPLNDAARKIYLSILADEEEPRGWEARQLETFLSQAGAAVRRRAAPPPRTILCNGPNLSRLPPDLERDPADLWAAGARVPP